MTAREQKVGTCDHCRKSFHFYLIHNGFNESRYAYCDRCGITAILNLYFSKSSQFSPGKMIHGRIPPEIGQHLLSCSCGGQFVSAAMPRCPHTAIKHCRQLRLPLGSTRTLPAQRGGWRWQRSWAGLYCIVIEHSLVQDNFV